MIGAFSIPLKSSEGSLALSVFDNSARAELSRRVGSARLGIMRITPPIEPAP